MCLLFVQSYDTIPINTHRFATPILYPYNHWKKIDQDLKQPYPTKNPMTSYMTLNIIQEMYVGNQVLYMLQQIKNVQPC